MLETIVKLCITNNVTQYMCNYITMLNLHLPKQPLLPAVHD